MHFPPRMLLESLLADLSQGINYKWQCSVRHPLRIPLDPIMSYEDLSAHIATAMLTISEKSLAKLQTRSKFGHFSSQ